MFAPTFALAALTLAAPAAVTIVAVEGPGFPWRVDGAPFVLKGAGGSHDKAALAAAGATGFRTWGVGEDTPAQLDEAQRLGLKVVLGIWLGHERHGFDYGDSAQVAAQQAQARQAVLRYRDHPAARVGGGHGMEGFAQVVDNRSPSIFAVRHNGGGPPAHPRDPPRGDPAGRADEGQLAFARAPGAPPALRLRARRPRYEPTPH